MNLGEDKTINNWVKIADYDLETAKAMNETGRYIYVAFTCQQCIEKLLKAIFVKQKKQAPVYTHNLVRLVELTGLELNKKQSDFINSLNAYYIKTRYTEEIDKLAKNLNKKKASELLENTEKLSKWLKEKIK